MSQISMYERGKKSGTLQVTALFVHLLRKRLDIQIGEQGVDPERWARCSLTTPVGEETRKGKRDVGCGFASS